MQIKTYPAKQVKNQLGAVLDEAQLAPVRITRNGCPIGGFVDQNRFNKLLEIERKQERKKLRKVINEMQEEAAAKGLTQEKLDAMLEDIYQEMYGEK